MKPIERIKEKLVAHALLLVGFLLLAGCGGGSGGRFGFGGTLAGGECEAERAGQHGDGEGSVHGGLPPGSQGPGYREQRVRLTSAVTVRQARRSAPGAVVKRTASCQAAEIARHTPTSTPQSDDGVEAAGHSAVNAGHHAAP